MTDKQQSCPCCGKALEVSVGWNEMGKPDTGYSGLYRCYRLIVDPEGKAYRVITALVEAGHVKFPKDWRLIAKNDSGFYDSEGGLYPVYCTTPIIKYSPLARCVILPYH